MKKSEYRSFDDLPLFLNAETVAKVLGVSPSSGYELVHEPGFPVLRIGSRMVVPKEQFIQCLGNSPADIFEKTVWVWAAFERARKVDIWP